MTTYLERLATDPDLRAFVAAEIARAGVDCSALRAELEKVRETATGQAKRIAELERDHEKKKGRGRST